MTTPSPTPDHEPSTEPSIEEIRAAISAVQEALDSPGDAHKLAALIWEEMPEPHLLVHHLSTALTGVGLTISETTINELGIEIGTIRTADALTLITVLGGTHPPRSNPATGRNTEAIADRLRGRLRRLSPEVKVTPHPACASCAADRPHQILIGTATLEEVRLLIEAIEAGTQERERSTGRRAGSAMGRGGDRA
ncbi:hypothetical protein [Streptomyces sp. NBC_00690]|uniref:hypothetical protein n=1 Tax=Streptomyces sp. NBC_00690 TaxID=2975808 RepID=UPI002E2891D5|nr:hypothetical protein [Streptomyces sp. NBC_00690]